MKIAIGELRNLIRQIILEQMPIGDSRTTYNQILDHIAALSDNFAEEYPSILSQKIQQIDQEIKSLNDPRLATDARYELDELIETESFNYGVDSTPLYSEI